MNADDPTAKKIDTTAHELSQQLQVLSMVLGAIERLDGARHAGELEAAWRALKTLDHKLEELTALARRD